MATKLRVNTYKFGGRPGDYEVEVCYGSTVATYNQFLKGLVPIPRVVDHFLSTLSHQHHTHISEQRLVALKDELTAELERLRTVYRLTGEL